MVYRKRPYERFKGKHVTGRRRICLVDSLFSDRDSIEEDLEYRNEVKDYVKSHYDCGWVAPKDDEESSEEI